MDPRSGIRRFRLRPRGREQVEAQMRDELDAHLAMAVEHYVARGMSRDQAEREARERFGDFDTARQRLYRSAEERDTRVRRRQTLDELRQDTRLAFRLFRRSPAFFAAAVLTLAVGVGANGAVFSILQAALLQPLPYHDPSELVMVWHTVADRAPPDGSRSPPTRRPLTGPMVLAWRRAGTDRVGEIAALLTQGTLVESKVHEAQLDLALGDRTVRLTGAAVTPNFFTLLGVRAAHGRVFGETDEATAEPLILLSDALWRRHFGGDPAVVGRSITLTGGGGGRRVATTYTVAGILPHGFHFTYPNEIEAWVLLRWSDIEQYDPWGMGFSAVARLKPGLSLAQAQRRAAELPVGPEPQPYVLPPERLVFGLEPMRDWVVGKTRPSLQLLGVVAVLLLLATCVTVANGLLARFSERQRELAVRAGLGAGRPRLVRQLFTEGALLAIGGVAAGTLLAIALQPVLRALLPASVPRIGELSVDASIVAFGAAMVAITTILAAVAPAWSGTRLDAAAMLTRSASTASARRSAVHWRQGLVAAQAAIATALLIFASLLLTSFWQLGRVPLGFDGDEVLTVDLALLDGKYLVADWAMVRFQDELLARVRAIPGIADVGLTSAVPFRGEVGAFSIHRSGAQTHELARARIVDAGYFRVLRISPVRGRLLTDADRKGGRRVMVVSESYANIVFGAEDPIGRTAELRYPTEIVGVVPDLRYMRRDEDPTPAVYLPRAQEPSPFVSIVARTNPGVSAEAVVPAIRRSIREIDPALPAMHFTTIDQLVDASVANRRFYTVATVAFASIALLLTIVGLATVVARVVAERRRELAIRAALGATTGDLARHATWDAMTAVGVGTLIGLAGAYAGSVALAQFLYHVASRSPTTYAAVAVLVLGVAGVAAWRPVRGLGRVPLAGLLRAE